LKRSQFDRIIRSVAQITQEPDVLVIGSQAILGSHPDLLDDRVVGSMDLDVSPLDGSDRHLHEISGVLGELTLFQNSNGGAYADSVAAAELAVLPSGWRNRLLRVESASMITPGGVQARAWCLHPNDIIVSKYAAGREKDLAYCETLIALNLAGVDRMQIEDGLREIATRLPRKSAIVDVALTSCRKAFESLRGRSGSRELDETENENAWDDRQGRGR
jgi:hypothetical protein